MFKRILVPVDGSAASRAGLRRAIEPVAVHHATLAALLRRGLGRLTIGDA